MWKWYTNGTENRRINEGVEPPEGWTPGMCLKPDVLERKNKIKKSKELEMELLKKQKEGKSRKERSLINEQTANTRSFNKFKKCLEKLQEQEYKIVLKSLKEGKTEEEIYELCKHIETPGLRERIKIRSLAWQLLKTPQYHQTIAGQLLEFHSQ